jgi:hypothetical protein
MTTTGSGNTWSKKNKYTICPFCGRKGRYTVSMLLRDGEKLSTTLCKYCNN